jgi:hypothetical protein
MTFFNKKEEVIQIKLTQYGKHLLSKGKFKPTYYAFFDDSVLYDSNYAGHTEVQNDIENRIQQDTPTLKVQHLYDGAETNFKKLTTAKNFLSFYEKDLPPPQTTKDRNYALAAPLGTSEIGSDDAPAFKVSALIGEITGSTETATGSHQILQIPQLDFIVEYKTHYGTDEKYKPDSTKYRSSLTVAGPGTYEDGSLILVEQDHLLLQISEDNVPFATDHFDMEVFLVEEEASGSFRNPGTLEPRKKKILRPLKFVKPPDNIVNNLLLDPDEQEVQNIPLDPNYVGYYFDLYVDHEIDNKVYCEVKINDEIEDIFDLEEFDCPDAGGPSKAMLPKSTTSRTYDVEECD